MAQKGRKQWQGLWAEMITAKVTVNPPSIATTADGSTTGTVTGAAVGDFVLAIPPYDMQEMVWSANVSAANTVEFSFYNASSGTVDLASGTWYVMVLRPDDGSFV